MSGPVRIFQSTFFCYAHAVIHQRICGAGMVFEHVIGPEGQETYGQMGIDAGDELAKRLDLLLVDLGDYQDAKFPEFVFGQAADILRVSEHRLG